MGLIKNYYFEEICNGQEDIFEDISYFEEQKFISEKCESCPNINRTTKNLTCKVNNWVIHNPDKHPKWCPRQKHKIIKDCGSCIRYQSNISKKPCKNCIDYSNFKLRTHDNRDET